jgi:integrase
MNKVPYLKQSKSGHYEYRRRIPEKHRHLFPLSKNGTVRAEWHIFLGTTDRTVAHRLWAIENDRFNSTGTDAQRDPQEEAVPLSVAQPNTTQATAIAKQQAIRAGLHPSQAPRLSYYSTEEEIDDFPTRFREWRKDASEYLSELGDDIQDTYLDKEQRLRDYEDGVWGGDGYQDPRLPIKPNDPKLAEYSLITGTDTPTGKATWSDAVELYLKINKRDTFRLPNVEHTWEVRNRNLLDKFGNAFGGSDNLTLEELDRQDVADWLWKTYPNVSTRNRYVRIFSALWNRWNTETKEPDLHNPFKGLGNAAQELELQASARRSFTPEEWYSYLDNVEECTDVELRLIGLLMLYTGCRTSEAYGLAVNDLKLQGNLPHVIFRTNSIRRMGKGGLERAVPLLTPVLNQFRGYVAKGHINSDKAKPLFPSYSGSNDVGKASVALGKLLKDKANITAPDLVPYSTRHTFTDRAIAAGIASDRAEYLTGHKSSSSSAVHRRYGTATPPQVLLNDMVKIFETTDWGYFE